MRRFTIFTDSNVEAPRLILLALVVHQCNSASVQMNVLRADHPSKGS